MIDRTLAHQLHMPHGVRPELMRSGHDFMASAARTMALTPEAYGLSPLSMPGRDDYRPYGTHDGLAIVSVYGCLVDKLGYWGGTWATGYDALRYQLAVAFADDEVRGIVLDVDSYGGMVAGCFDLVDWIVAAKAAAKKPIIAILSECAYSAAYAIASTADHITVPRTGGVGSIGCILVHWDISGALEKWGERPTQIAAGDHKGDGNPYGPLPDDVLEKYTDEIRAMRDLFAETVARNRGAAGVKITIEAIIDTQSRTFEGPVQTAEAVRLGLADLVAAPADAFEQFHAYVNQGD